MLDSLRPFVIPALSAKGQKLAFVTRGPFSCRRRRRRHGRGAGRHKSGEPCMRAGSNAQAWAGRGTGTQIIRTGTVFQCAPAAADPAAAARGELTEVGAERSVQRWAEIFRQATCAALPSSRPGQKLVGWGCEVGAAVFLYSKPTSQSQTASFYQEALRTPGIWPLYASSRKQIRQMP